MSAEEINNLRQQKETEMKMIEQKEREKAIAEGKEADPEGKYSGGENGNRPKLEGSGMTGGSGTGTTRGGSGTTTRGGSSSTTRGGTGSGSGATVKNPNAGATTRKK